MPALKLWDADFIERGFSGTGAGRLQIWNKTCLIIMRRTYLVKKEADHMIINQEKCIGCGLCVVYCTGNAIRVEDQKASVDLDQCTECGVCRRVAVCPRNAIEQPPLKWPRSVRAIYSDPLNIHKETGLAGRGTEEIKTNDVTNRFKLGEIGVAIEVGRPNLGCRLRELQKYTNALAQKGIHFEPRNPLTNLIDPISGDLPQEILNEKVISAIIEFTVPEGEIDWVMQLIDQVAQTVDTVTSVDLAGRFNDGWPGEKYLKRVNRSYRPNAKINVGLGRLLDKEEE